MRLPATANERYHYLLLDFHTGILQLLQVRQDLLTCQLKWKFADDGANTSMHECHHVAQPTASIQRLNKSIKPNSKIKKWYKFAKYFIEVRKNNAVNILYFKQEYGFTVINDVPFNRRKSTAVRARLFLEYLSNIVPQQKTRVPRECRVVDDQQQQKEREVDDWSTEQCIQQC